MAPLVSLLTDFGTRDPWVAICKGVILGLVPDARLIDITHEIAPFDVVGGAVTLADVLHELPVGIHLAVVDPGVGTDRRAIGVRTLRGDVLVGPDNGLLLPAADRLGGIVAVHELRDARFRRASVARTFQGRDVFAPAAGHLAIGVPLEQFGPAVSSADLVALDLPRAELETDRLRTAVLAIDEFGNVELAGSRRDLEGAVGQVRSGDRLLVEWWLAAEEARRLAVPWGDTFAAVGPGDLLVYEDSLGRLAIAMNQGDAAAELGITRAATVTIVRDR